MRTIVTAIILGLLWLAWCLFSKPKQVTLESKPKERRRCLAGVLERMK